MSCRVSVEPHAKRRREMLSHFHYSYRMFYNDVKRIRDSQPCTQPQRISPSDTHQRLYSGESHCCFVENVPRDGTCQASRGSLNFLRSIRASYIDTNCLQDIGLDGTVPVNDVVEPAAFNNLGIDLQYVRATFVEELVLATEKKESDLVEKLVYEYRTMPQLLVVDKEVQFNSWMVRRLKEVLQPKNFAVSDKSNFDPNILNSPVNEFSRSVPDCLVYHRSCIRQSGNPIAVVMRSANDDSQEIEDQDIQTVDLHGQVFETKNNSIGDFANSECRANMFGAAAKICSAALSNGVVVDTVTMYGMVFNMHQLKEVTILHSFIDFVNGTCTYQALDHPLEFAYALNMILKKLTP